MRYPFRVFANENLGTQYDYTAFSGEWVNPKSTGYANVLPEINIATGNVILKSTTVKTQEQIGNWEFGFVYNAQNTMPWTMNIPGIVSSNTTQLSFQENDGSQVTYNWDATQNAYVSPSGSHSKFLITQNPSDKTYVQLDPKTGARTLFDATGKITAVYDARGCGMQYGYTNGVLQTITSAAGVYTISTANLVTSLTFIATGQSTSETLGEWTFDSSQRLQTATIPSANNYEVNYKYNGTTNQVTSVAQTDGTSLALTYTTDNPAKVETIQQGSNGVYTFAYTGNETTVTDALGFITTATLNSNNTIATWTESVGDTASSATALTTTCTYSNNDLSTITKPNKAQTSFTLNAQGLITQKIDPQNQTTQYTYDSTTFALVAKSELQNGSGDSAVYATTRFTYHNNVRQIPGTTLPCRDLRFIVSPQGCVNELRYSDSSGLLISNRTYLQNAYSVSALTPTTAIAFSDAETWVSAQTASAISLSAMRENLRGQTTSLRKFANITSNGAGNFDEFASHDQFSNHTLWGAAQTQIEKVAVQNSTDITATTQDAYDGLHRLTSHQNALANTKTIQYNDAAQNSVVTEYNGRTETSNWDAAGQITSVTTAITGAVSRVVTNTFDTAGRLSSVTGVDGQITYHLFDSLNRPRFVITPTGRVTEYFYDAVNHYSSKIRYYTKVPISTLTPPLSFSWITANLTKDSKKDATTYSVYDLSGRLEFKVKGNGSVTGYSYDLQNRKYLTTTYQAALSSSEITAIQNGTFTRTPSASDCVQATFYDNDNNITATQDGDNYITQHQRNVAGVENLRTQFATPGTQNLTGTVVLPTSTEKDFSQYLYSDARGQRLLTVDGATNANYVVQNSFYPNGKLQTETKFANQASIVPSTDSDPTKLIPTSDPEDQTTTNTYDLLNRLVQQNLPQQRLKSWSFDSMGNVLLECIGDDPAATTNPQTHGTAKQFDNWGQLTQEATPLVYAKILSIQNDETLTPTQIATQVAAVWTNQALQYQYNNQGLYTAKVDIVPDNATSTTLPITFLFYDADKKLVLTVGPEGQATQITPDPIFNKTEEQTHYATAVNTTGLTGGFITPAVTALITSDSTQDQTDQYQYDRAGNLSQHTDAEGYVSEKHTDMFGNNDQESLPVDSETPSLQITRTFNFRGSCTQEVKTAGTDTITTSKAYENLHGSCTSSTDGNGNSTTFTHEPRGVLSTFTDANNNTTTLENDAFEREILRTESMGQSVAHRYVQASRQIKTKKLDVSGTVLTETSIIKDAFGNNITLQDALGNTTQLLYNAANQWETKLDANDNQYSQQHDLRGLLIKTNFRQSNSALFSSTSTFDYSLSRQLRHSFQDTTGLNLETEREWNALGQEHKTTTPNGNIRKMLFDLRSLATEHQKIVDDTTSITTAQSYNGLQTASTLSTSTTNLTHTYQEQLITDGFGREYQRIVDPISVSNPTGLALTHTKELDGANRLIATVDPKNQTSYIVRDAVGNIRFEINAKGGVTENQYNAENKPIFTAQYITAIALTSLSVGMTVADVQALVTAIDYDRHTYYFYDDLLNERFRVNRAGAIVETRYDLNNEKISSIQYYTPITTDLTTLTTAALITQCALIRNTTSDKASFRVLDPAGQEVFIINADGSVIQKFYNSTLHKVNCEIKYATTIADPESTAALSIAGITALLTSSAQDRQTYWMVDGLNRLQFHVAANGAVTRYDYDGNTNNRIKITEFAASVTLPVSSYSALQTILNNLVPNPAVDNIEVRAYDAAEREITRTNGLGNAESFGYDGANRRSSHTTLSGNKWTYDYDGASRLWHEYSPATTVYSASIDPANVAAITITPSATPAAVVKEINYDANSNVIGITSGVGLSDEHIVNFAYSALNLKNQDTWNNVPVDDPTQVTSLTVRPEKIISVNKTVIHGANGAKLVETNEAGNSVLYSYDAQGYLKYKIDEEGYVFEFQRNSFGECEHLIVYATQLTISLTSYANGSEILTPDIIAANLTKVPTSDRSFNQTFDQNGRTIQVTRDPVVCYIPDPNQNAPTIATQTPTRQLTYNAFGETLAVTVLVDGTNGISRQTLTWYDQNGNEIATVDANGKAIIKTFDTWNRQVEEHHYVNPIPQELMPSVGTSFSDLQSLLTVAVADKSKDHHIKTPRDIIGNITDEINVGVVTQQAVSGQQAFTDNPATDLDVQYTYTKDNKVKSITDPDGNVKINYYDERRYLVATAGVVCTQPDGTQIRPITYYRRSIHGDRVETYKPQSGCAVTLDPTSETLPVPLEKSDKDHYHRFMRDAKRNVLVKQDPENNLQQTTHTATGKIARKFKPTTNPKPTKANPTQVVVHLDETRKAYSARDKLNSSGIYRDSTLQSQIAYQHDAFNLIAEGPDDGTRPVQHQYDQGGRKWSTVDSKGAAQLIGHNAAGEQTLEIESTTLTVDLSTVPYSQLASTMGNRSDVASYEFNETVRDPGGRPTAFVEPGYPDTANPGNTVLPVYQIGLDNFNKKSETIKPDGSKTKFTRNKLNKLATQTDPAITVLDESGNSSTAIPVTTYGYNNLSGKIGVRDANNHTRLLTRDEANRVVSHIEGDGTISITNTLDVFNNAVKVTSASGNTWQKTFSRKDKVTQIILPSGDTWNYTLNENDFVRQITPPDGAVTGSTLYAQGPYGDMSARYSPKGESDLYTNDPHHNILSHQAINTDGSTAYTTSATRDFWGKETFRTDGSGSTYTTSYYNSGVLYQELGVNIAGHGEIPVFDSATQTFTQNTQPMPLKSITKTYLTKRRLDSIADGNTVRPQTLTKIFDINRNPLSITEADGAGNLLRQTEMEYNSLDWPVKQTDINFSMDTDYDPVGNRRRVNATYTPTTGSVITHDGWWTYDAADRVWVNDGVLGADKVIASVFTPGGTFGYYPPTSQGNTFSYTQGLRTSQSLLTRRSMGSLTNASSATFGYDVDDRLSTITTQTLPGSDTSSISLGNGQSVPANYPENIIYTTDGLFNTSYIPLSNSQQFTLNGNTYNLNGDLNGYNGTRRHGKTAATYSSFNVDGYPTNTSSTWTDTNGSITDALTFSFLTFKSSVVGEAKGTRTDQYGKSTPVSFLRYYDSNDALSSVPNVYNPFNPNDPNPNTLFFDNSLDGRILAENSVSFSTGVINAPTRYFHDAEGHITAECGMISDPLKQTEVVLQATANPVSSFSISSLLNQITSITIQSGDDWATLSYRACGDASLSFILHAYSGVPLIPGQVINLQKTMDAYNKAIDYKPYQKLMDVIYNSMNPALKTPQPPPPPPPHHESFWDEIIGIVVAVVVMYFAPEIGAFIFQTTAALGAVETGVAYAVAGAIADAATQGVAIAFDDQHGFSTKEMFENAMAAGVTAGVSKELGMSDLLKDGKYAKAFAESLGVGLTVQLAQMAAGLRDKLDLKLIIEQATATVLQAKLDKKLATAPKAMTHGVDELANTTVGAAFGEQPDLTSLAGNYLGDEVDDGADYLGKKIKSQPSTKIGETSKHTSFSDKIQSVQTAPQFISPESAANDSAFDLYDTYENQLSGGVNAIVKANCSAALSSVQTDVEIHHAQRMQQRQTRVANNPDWESDLSGVAHMFMHGLASTGQWLETSLNTDANIASRMDPFSAMYEAASGCNPITGQPVSIDQAYENFGTSMAGLFSGEAAAGVLGYAGRFASETLPSVGRNIAGMFGRGASDIEQTVYHTVTSARGGQGVLDGIDPLRLNSDSRFGKAFYLSETPDTTVAELAYHNNSGVETIRYNFNKTAANILDLTDPAIAKQWGYSGGDSYDIAQGIAGKARHAGFDVIRYQSERGVGANLAVMSNFENLLSPQMIAPVPQEFSNQMLSFYKH